MSLTQHLPSAPHLHFTSLRAFSHLYHAFRLKSRKMEVERAGPAPRTRGNVGHPAKKITPPKAKNTVSAAAIFKRQQPKAKQVNLTPPENFKTPRLTVVNASGTKSPSAKSRSSSHSPQNAGRRASRKKADMHPLAVEFRDTTDEYRRQLYKTASLKINKTLEALIDTLYESTMQTITSNDSQQDTETSPLKLSVAAKYERLARQLYEPLAMYEVRLQRTNTREEQERFFTPLEARMTDYDEHLAKKTQEIAKLQKAWEVTVGEIWKLGVSCLGEGVMEDLLFTKQPYDNTSLSKTTDAESTLFVSEQVTSPSLRKARMSNKHVSFEDDATSTSKFPEFLFQASRYHKDTLPAVPAMPEREIEELEKEVMGLGKKEIEEFRKIEKDHQAYWKRKTNQLAVALRSD
ncbi:hypothetical protein EJ02DRAFT_220239 [Clathrospora elynae]|uniref:Uncharacterized protein n=1 Tax=Clathrospora elynae TaxID=706981 RepID=A0A6A5SJQ4_9PLEO|nr:hypothetical protein EJ02DRAFT_220239 [Clathrospora elynae]